MNENIFPPNRAWGLKSTLSLDESIFLAIGIDPMVRFDELSDVDRSQYYTLDKILKYEIETSVLAANWLENGEPTDELPFTEKNTTIFKNRSDEITNIDVSAQVISKWFIDRNYTWPFNANGQPEPRNKTNSDDTIDPRLEKNYLKVIVALLSMAKLKESGGENAIELLLHQLKYKSPTNRTIGKIIKKAKELPFDGDEENLK